MLRHTLSAALLAFAAPSHADVFVLPGSSGFRAAEHEPGHHYRCANTGSALLPSAGEGYGRCKAVFPLTGAVNTAVSGAQVTYSSNDKASSITAWVYRTNNDGSVTLLSAQSDYAVSNSVMETMALAVDEPVLSGVSVFAVVEVRGDTHIVKLRYEVL